MRTIRVSASDWPSVLVSVPESFLDRFLGIRSPNCEGAILMSGGPLHTIGLKKPIWMAGLDDEMKVVEVRDVPPGRLVWLRGADRVLELDGISPPVIGAELAITDA